MASLRQNCCYELEIRVSPFVGSPSYPELTIWCCTKNFSLYHIITTGWSLGGKSFPENGYSTVGQITAGQGDIISLRQ